MSGIENRHEEMTKVVTAHMPVAFFSSGGKGKASTSCTCGRETTGYNKTPEEIHAEHIVLELEKVEFLAAEKPESVLRVGDRVKINSKSSRFHDYEGTLVQVLSSEQEVVPYRVLLDEHPEQTLPFFKSEVVPGKKKPKYRIGEMVYISNRGSEMHGRVCRVVDTESLGGDLCIYQLRMVYSTLIVAEYEKNLKSVHADR